MSVACQVFKTSSGAIEKVVAPNGNESFLFEKAFEQTGDLDTALSLWSTAYTPGFKKYYGYWDSPALGEYFETDHNGEPLLDSVLKYLEKETNKAGIFSSREIEDIQSMMSYAELGGISELGSVIKDNFFIAGNITLTRSNLVNSGLYTKEEADRIMSDESVKETVIDSMEKIMDYTSSGEMTDRDMYYLNTSPEGPLIYKGDEYNRLGKRVSYNPAEIDYIIIENAAGIKDSPNFIGALENAGIDDLSQSLESDPDYASSLMESYQDMEVVPEVSLGRDGSVIPYNPRVSELEYFSMVNPNTYPKIRTAISDFLRMDSIDEEGLKLLRDIERMAIDFGIDIIGLSDSMSDKESIDNMLMSLDIHLSAIHRGIDADVTGLADDIDRVLGRGRQERAVMLPQNLAGQPVVYLESDLSERALFENNLLLKVGDNIYIPLSNNNETIEQLYTSISDMILKYPESFNYPIFPSSYYKDGVLDYDKVKQSSDSSEIKEFVRSYVLQNTSDSVTEKMNLAKMIVGINLGAAVPVVDIQKEFDIYTAMQENESYNSDISDIRKDYLMNKYNNTDLYDKVYKHIRFNSYGGISLRSDDMSIKNSIDLNLKGEQRQRFMAYALNSVNESIKDTFFVERQDISLAGDDFYHYLYSRNPELLTDYTGRFDMVGNLYSVAGKYDSFIKINGQVLSKVSEDNSGGIYSAVTEMNANAYKYQLSQEVYLYPISDTRLSENPDIKQEFNLTEKEKNSLDYLEC